MDALENVKIRQHFSNDLNNKSIPAGLAEIAQLKKRCPMRYMKACAVLCQKGSWSQLLA